MQSGDGCWWEACASQVTLLVAHSDCAYIACLSCGKVPFSLCSQWSVECAGHTACSAVQCSAVRAGAGRWRQWTCPCWVLRLSLEAALTSRGTIPSGYYPPAQQRSGTAAGEYANADVQPSLHCLPTATGGGFKRLVNGQTKVNNLRSCKHLQQPFHSVVDYSIWWIELGSWMCSVRCSLDRSAPFTVRCEVNTVNKGLVRHNDFGTGF